MAPPETIAERVEKYTQLKLNAASRLQASNLPEFFSRKLYEERLRQNDLLQAINHVFEKSLSCQGEEELARLCLQEALHLTGSEFGWIGEVDGRAPSTF